MKKYIPQQIEKKWQKYWEGNRQGFAKENSKKQKKFVLIEFPYILHQDVKFNQWNFTSMAMDGFILLVNGFEQPLDFVFDDLFIHDIIFTRLPDFLTFVANPAIKIQNINSLNADRKK